ncbi:MAG: TCR/Tet family MFS transporter [Phycisphaerales bacterium]
MRKPAVGFIFITLLLDVLGFGLLIPVAPRLVMSLQGHVAPVASGPMAAAQPDATNGAAKREAAQAISPASPDGVNDGKASAEGDAAPVVGALSALYAVMLFLCAPVLGALSDRFGRRPVLLVALFGSALDYLAMAFAPTLAWLFITRALNGLSGASMSTANAYIADVTPPEKRAAGFGMAGAAFGLGFVLGPLIGGILGEIDIRYPFFAAAALTLANWIYGFFVLPESLPADRRSTLSFGRVNPLGVFRHLGAYPVVAGLAAALFLLNMAQFALHTTWVLYTSHRFQWSPTDVGLSLFAVGLGAAVVQAGLAKHAVKRLGERASLLLGICLGVAAFTVYGLATHGWMIYVGIVIGSFGGISMPAAQAIITKAVKPTEQGQVQGALTGLQSVANIFGPLVGSAVFGYTAKEVGHVYFPGAVYLVSAGLSVVGAIVAWRVLARFMPTSPASPRTAD